MIIYAAVFLLLAAAALLVAWAARMGTQSEKAQMALSRLDSYDVQAYRRLELSTPAEERLLAPIFDRIAGLARAITPTGRIRRLEERTERAGRPWNLDVNGLLAVKLVSLMAGLFVLVILASLHLVSTSVFLLLAAAVVIFTYYLPDLLLSQWITERKRRISRELPNFLDLLTVTVEAGLGLDAAMAKIAERLPDPLRQEILITLHHVRVGQSREVALREFARRCDVEELTTFVSTLIQSQRLGVSLGHILRTQSATMRVTRRQKIEEAAQKAPVKLLFPLIFLIFPAMFVVILGPAAIRIYEVLVR